MQHNIYYRAVRVRWRAIGASAWHSASKRLAQNRETDDARNDRKNTPRHYQQANTFADCTRHVVKKAMLADPIQRGFFTALARASGRSVHNVWDSIMYHENATVPTLLRYAQALGCTVDDVIRLRAIARARGTTKPKRTRRKKSSRKT